MTILDDLADEIMRGLENYSNDITKGVKLAVGTVAKEVNTEIKKHISFKEHTGDYVKAFRIKSVYDGRYSMGKTWYVANGEHTLTHLLENGHALQQGGRASAYPHIKYGEELAIKRMEELSREAVENANGH